MKISDILQLQVDALVRNVTQLTVTPNSNPEAYDCVRKLVSGELVRKQDLTVITGAMAKRAARGFRTAGNFIAIAHLRMSKLKHLPPHPFVPAVVK